jgi:acetyl-CoA acyltransferase
LTAFEKQVGRGTTGPGHAAILAREAAEQGADVVVACGVESMSRIPMGTAGLGQDPFGPSVHARFAPGLVGQGISAELICAKWNLTRDELDEFSSRSHVLAAGATDAGWFDNEIVPVSVTDADGEQVEHVVDETVRPTTTPEGLSKLAPSFVDDTYAARFPEID